MPLILGTNSIKDTGFDVANSLRFDRGSTDYLRTTGFGTATSSRKMTISFWCKKSLVATGNQRILVADTSDANNNRDDIHFTAVAGSCKFNLFLDNGTAHLRTNRSFNDVSAWYHIVVAIDTTQGTSSDRIKIYVNGEQETSFDSSGDGIVYPSQNYDLLGFGQNREHTIGADTTNGNTDDVFGGYLAEYCFIDGQQLDATSFGEFDEDSGIWKPKAVSGLTFGTNGFYLDFENSGSLGADVSGNGNNFTVNNLTAIDQTTDTCTNNFCTLNPLFAPPTNPPTYSDGNLTSITDGAAAEYGWGGATSIGVSSGKWYCEAKWTQGGAYSRGSIGVTYDPSMSAYRNGANSASGSYAYGWGYRSYDGVLLNNGSTIWTGNTYATGDIIGIYLDLDNHKLYISKNGVLENSGTGANLTTGETYHIYQEDITGTSSTSKFEFNFGNPTYTISSGNSDPNGYGNFEYSTTITGDSISKDFYALNTKNLAEYG